jgi:hypothetical protein
MWKGGQFFSYVFLYSRSKYPGCIWIFLISKFGAPKSISDFPHVGCREEVVDRAGPPGFRLLGPEEQPASSPQSCVFLENGSKDFALG